MEDDIDYFEKWKKLLSGERQWDQDPPPKDDPRNEFEHDIGRILYSSAFRRLQDKTQVFPLGRNDYVRTRLTHSYEVGYVGNSLGRLVGYKLVDRYEKDERYQDTEPQKFIKSIPSQIASIVSAACLAHDIGNPPFGHLGESVIEEVLKEFKFDEFKGRFEGNAQGFRVLTRLLGPSGEHGLNLTAATLGAFAKYPCTEDFSDSQKDANGCVHSVECKKFGYIPEDKNAMQFVAKKTGMIPIGKDSEGHPVAWHRHPLAFLTEAADDLCYLIADIEDAYVSGVISFREASNQLGRFLNKKERDKAKMIGRKDKRAAVHHMRARAVSKVIYEVRNTFLDNEKEILQGKFSTTLIEKSELRDKISDIRKFSEKHIYNSTKVVEIELRGVNVIRALVNFFGEWVNHPQKATSRKIERFIGRHALGCEGKRDRLLCMLDYISGMTDSFALATYRKIQGIWQ